MKVPRVSPFLVLVVVLGGFLTLLTFAQLPLDALDSEGPSSGPELVHFTTTDGCEGPTAAAGLTEVSRNRTVLAVGVGLDVTGWLNGGGGLTSATLARAGDGAYVLDVSTGRSRDATDCASPRAYEATVSLPEPGERRTTLVVVHDGRLAGVVTVADGEIGTYEAPSAAGTESA